MTARLDTVAPAALNRAGDLLLGPLCDAVATLPAPVQEVVRYHLEGVGKGIRGALAVLSAEAASAPVHVGMPGAVAVQLVHEFSLLHDDVMDRDLERRHRPAAWTVFGEAPALLAGTSLLARAQAVLLAHGARGARAACRLEEATQQLVAGQALDLSFEARPSVTVDEWRVMAQGKTAALLSAAAAIGAELAGADPALVSALARFGAHLGVAFQAVDDVLGSWGCPNVTGKPVGGDIRRGKKTLPLVAALDAGCPAAQRLGRLVAVGPSGDEDVAAIAALIEELRGPSLARAEADAQLGLALAALERASVAAPARAALVELAQYVTVRMS